MSKQIEAIRQRLANATDGLWAVDPLETMAIGHVCTPDGDAICQTQPRVEWIGDHDGQNTLTGRANNATFIANAPTDIKLLLDEVERLEAEVDVSFAEGVGHGRDIETDKEELK